MAIDSKKAEQADHHTGITEIDKNLEQLRSALSDVKDLLQNIQQEKSELENSLNLELENINRSEAHMKEIRTNKEYQAVGREISAARKQISEIEEQILQKSVRIDELQADIDRLSTELATVEQSSGIDRNRLQGSIDQLQAEINEGSASRDSIVKELATTVVRRYNQLREQRRGQALAEAREGSCLGCNMNLPPQLYNTLFRGEDLHYCPHCQRILFLRQEEQG